MATVKDAVKSVLLVMPVTSCDILLSLEGIVMVVTAVCVEPFTL